jgi:predicted esterase
VCFRCCDKKVTRYCSRECQTENWRSHKKQCNPPSEQSDLSSLSLQRSQPPAPEHGLACQFAHSADNIDTNLVIVIHGNGDNEVNFLRFAGKLTLPLSALLSVRGPIAVGMQGQMWYPEVEGFQPSKENKMRVKPLWEAGELVAAQMRLAEKSGWPSHRIFLLGHGHGGVVAVDAARKYGRMLGGVVASGDAVLEEAVMDDPIPTRVEKHVQVLLPVVFFFFFFFVTSFVFPGLTTGRYSQVYGAVG